MSVVEVFGVSDTLHEKSAEHEKALALSAEAMKEAVSIFDSADFKSNDGWKKEAEDNGSTVHSKNFPYGKLFALRTEINAPASVLFQDHWDGVEQLSSWNSNIQSAKVLVKLGDQSDVIYNAMNDIMIVKGRDFVGGRMWRKVGESYVVAGKSTELALMPAQKGKVR
uniref:START domain-containing protein n=1 Tax=Plectus sambesii TaxID=2011161 RepID=A0A914XLK9_9BILA